LCLIAFFALLHSTADSFDLWNAAGLSRDAPSTALLVLALLGFGMKAGVFPLHVWLPGAHANAPSHVSAILSGVMLNMGIYGLIRVTALPALPPVWWGGVLLALGGLSALLGITYAMAQQDYKRLLAYSSIENLGIITMGLGLALLGKSTGHAEWVALGLGAALFHVLNHSLFKPMLFLGAGNLLHAVHTRCIDRLGGLAKRMPLTFGIFMIGGIAICGLPPLNGFVSEWILYLGLLRTTQTPPGSAWVWAALAVPLLATVGALAVATFVKLLGIVFLGTPRRLSAAHPGDPGAAMMLPPLLLAASCVAIGFFPALVLPLLDRAVAAWNPPGATLPLDRLLPWTWQTWAAVALVGAIATVTLWMWFDRKRPTAARTGTWDCGYVKPTSRMQYTGASFGQMLLDLFAWAIWPRAARLRMRQLFPAAARFSSDVPDAVLDRALLPALRAGESFAARGRVVQHGSVQAYLVYVMVIIALLLLLGQLA
jgi:formate hydrogenlyase subunit 3/multisubunit Na+/H+ antiporter MnhD subunit